MTTTTTAPVAPMLLGSIKPEQLAGRDWSGWIVEPKVDGVRAIVESTREGIRVWSRRGNELTDDVPDVVEALTDVLPVGCILDGEVAIVRALEEATYGVHPYMVISNLRELSRWRVDQPKVFVAFDLLVADGPSEVRKPYIARPWTERRRYLRELLADYGPTVFLSPAWDGSDSGTDGRVIARDLAWVVSKGGEGIVLKRSNSIYRPGVRSSDWLKCKPATA